MDKHVYSPLSTIFFPKRAEDDDDEIFLQKSQDSSNLLGKLGQLTTSYNLPKGSDKYKGLNRPQADFPLA